MKNKLEELYQDYERMPYIAKDRDIELYLNKPELFPYHKVEKKQMEILEQGLVAGDIIMLWRIHFNNFDTTTIIPQYFEYRYGVNSDESITLLLKLNLIELCSATDSLDALTSPTLKKIIDNKKLKKAELIQLIKEEIPEAKLSELFTLRKYKITEQGTIILDKYQAIISKHGTKK